MTPRPQRPHGHRRRDDSGAILPLAVVVVLVFGVLAAALASYGAVSFRHHRVIRLQTSLRASADAGLRYGLEKVRLGQSLCADVPGSLADQAIPIPVTPNGATVTVTCRYVSGNLPAANEWAAILTGIGATSTMEPFQSHGASSVFKRIDGPVFLQITEPATNAFDLQAPVRINEGDLWYHAANCAIATAPTISNLSIIPSPPRTRLCTTYNWQDLAPMPPLPAKPLPIDPSGRDDLVAGCRVFFPGAYAAPPALGGDNYFVSGEFYFEFNDTLEIKQADVQGGQPSPYSQDVPQLANLAPGCADVLSNPTVAAAETGFGVTWLLGGGAKIDVNVHGRIELFGRAQGAQEVSIQAIETAGSGYLASTIDLTNGPILSMKEGNTNDMVIHGLIRTPRAQIEFGNVTNTVSAQSTGGIVAASINLQGSASASGWMIGRSNRPAATKVMLTSRATDTTGVSVTMQAIADYRGSRTVDDAQVWSGLNLVYSPTAAFTANDEGSYIIATSLPARTVITSVLTPEIAWTSNAAIATRTNVVTNIRTPQVAVNSWRKL